MSNQNKEKKGANKKDDFKINFWNSIKAKILLLVFGAILLTVLLNLLGRSFRGCHQIYQILHQII